MGEINVYESIMTGLNEALEEAQNEKPMLKRNNVMVESIFLSETHEVMKSKNTTDML